MKQPEKETRLRLNPWRVALIFLGLFLFLEVVFYFTFQGFSHLWPPDNSFYVYTVLLAVTMIVLGSLAAAGTYYVIDRDKITHVSVGRKRVYFFRDILYIDEAWSKRHKMLLFYDTTGHDHYLAFDRKGVLYASVLHLARPVSREEFKERFPNVKL